MIHLFSIFNDFIAFFATVICCLFGAAVEKFHFTFFVDSWEALLIEQKIQFCVFFFFSALIYFYLVEQKKSTLRIYFIFSVWLTFTLYGNNLYNIFLIVCKYCGYETSKIHFFIILYLEITHNLWYGTIKFNDIEICYNNSSGNAW